MKKKKSTFDLCCGAILECNTEAECKELGAIYNRFVTVGLLTATERDVLLELIRKRLNVLDNSKTA